MIKEQGVGRFLTNQFVRVGVQISFARCLTSCILKLIHPIRFVQRKLSARNISVDLPNGLKELGYAKVDGSALQVPPNEVVKELQNIFECKSKDIEKASIWPEHILKYVLEGSVRKAEEPVHLRAILKFLSQKDILDVVTKYIGEFPILGNVTFGYFDVSTETIGGKSVHRDMNTPNRVHLIILVSDVDSKSGPFTVLNRTKSAEVSKILNYTESAIEDSVFFDLIDKSEMQELCGRAGEVFMVDPFQCFHFGGRCTDRSRLMLIASYTSAFGAQEEQYALARLENRKEFCDESLAQRKLLNL